MIKSNTPNLDKLAKAHYHKLKDDLILKINSGVDFIDKRDQRALSDKNKTWLNDNLKKILIESPNKLIELYNECELSFPNINYKTVFNYDWF